MRRFPRSSMALAMLLALHAATAGAQEASDQDEARRVFESGVAAAQAGRWEEALERFRRADELLVNPNIRINLAAALVQSFHLIEAAALYERILDEHADELSVAQVEDLEQVLERVRRRIPSLEVRLRDASEPHVIEVDGEVMAETSDAVTLPLDPGVHALRVRLGDEVIATREVRMEEVQRLTMIVPVGPAASAPPQSRRTEPNWPAIVSMAGGGALLLGMIGPWVGIASIQDDPAFVEARASLPSHEHVCDVGRLGVDDLCSRASAFEAVQWALLSVGSAAVAFGAVLFLIDGPELTVGGSATVRPVIGPTLAGVELREAF